MWWLTHAIMFDSVSELVWVLYGSSRVYSKYMDLLALSSSRYYSNSLVKLYN